MAKRGVDRLIFDCACPVEAMCRVGDRDAQIALNGRELETLRRYFEYGGREV